MCLSSVYKQDNNENVFVCKNVAKVLCNENDLIVYNLFGEQTVLQGSVIEIDLMENTILIKEG